MYQLTSTTTVRRSDGAYIPADPANTDYAAYLAWVAEGNTPDPADVPDPKAAIRSEILNLERTQLLPRATREFMLLAMEAQAPAEVLALNPGYVAVKAFDNLIAEQRAQL